MAQHRIPTCAIALLLAVAIAPAAEYLVSPTGQDMAGGGTTAAPWRTIAYALGQAAAGDTIRLSGGAVFAENLRLTRGGIVGAPITLTSDPANRATIRPPDASRHGIELWQVGYVTIEHLVIAGPGAEATGKAGIAAQSQSGRYPGITLRHLDVGGWYEGIEVFGWGGAGNGFSGLLIEDCDVHHHRHNAANIWADTIGGHRDLVVRRCVFRYTPGDPTLTRNSGSGCAMGGTIGGLIEQCVAHHSGGAGTANEGPVGLWTYDSAQVVIRSCEAYAIHALHMDGDGFDIDQNTTDCVVEHCYAHDNDGAGFLFCQGGSQTWRGNTIRYCISLNDGRAGRMGGIQVFASSNGTDDGRIYNNVVCNAYAPALWFDQASGTTGMTVRNNVFLTANGKELVKGSAAPGVALFQQNAYWSGSGAFRVAGQTSLAAWRSAAGQEMLGGAPVGIQADPLLVAPWSGGIVGDPARLPTLTGYQLQDGFPLIAQGIDQRAAGFGAIAIGTRDFFGNVLPASGLCIGAHQRSATTTNRAPAITTAKPAALAMLEDRAGTVGLAATDADGDGLTWSVSTQGTKGSAALSGTGGSRTLTYTPHANANGSDSCVVTVSDGRGGSDTITVNVTITAVNDVPLVAATVPNQTADVGSAFSYTIPAGTIIDADGDPLTWSASGLPAGLLFTAATRTISGTPSASGAATVTVTARDPANAGASTAFTLTVGLPVGWSTGDIGAVAAAGSAGVASGAWTLTGSGADIWGTADEFRYAWRTVTGDISITATVSTLSAAQAWAKVGVMIRESGASGSRHAFTCVTAGNGTAFQRRTTTDGSSTHTAGTKPSPATPYRVRLQRVGDLFIAAVSVDGSTWREIGRQTIAMTATVRAGLAVTSHADGTLATATFTAVDIVGAPSAAN